MGGGGKRKSRGGGEGPANSRKRRTSAAETIPTQKEESPLNSDIDEPQVEDIIKVELESDVDPGQDDDHQGFFDDPGDQDLALNSEIDIGEVDVKVLQYPEAELTRESEEVRGVHSNMINEAEPIGLNIRVISVHSISKPSDLEGSVRSAEYEVGSTLEDEDGGEDTAAAATTVGTRHTEGTAAVERAQKMMPRPGDSKKEVSSIPSAVTAVKPRDVKNAGNLLSTIQEKDGQIARLTKDLQAATRQIECLQGNVNSKSSRIQELSSQIKQLDEEVLVLNGTVDCKGLNAELKKARNRQQEATGKIKELKNSILEKDRALAEFKARYFSDEEGNSQLHLAAKMGDDQAIENLIQLGANVNARNNHGETPIFLVGTSELEDYVGLRMVADLIRHGADVYATDHKGQTFLHKFASTESTLTPSQFHDISSYLVSRNRLPLFNARNGCSSSTPIMLAAVNAKLLPRTASLLHENGFDFKFTDNNGNSVLCYAVEVHNNRKLPPATVNPEQTTGAADEELVKLLVQCGADVNVKNTNSETPLYLAAVSKNVTFAINIVKFLIDSGAKVDARCGCGSCGPDQKLTFLHRLLQPYPPTTAINPTQFHDIAVFLISKNLSRLFNIRGDYFMYKNATPFQVAVGRVEIERATLSLLKKNGVDFNAVGRDEHSVLCSAIIGNRTLRLVSDLVDLGANPRHLYDTGKYTMLHLAASKGRPDLLKFFLDKGLDVNAQGTDGCTPLFNALSCYSKQNVLRTVQFLLRNGANSDIKCEAWCFDKSLSPREYFEIHRDEFTDVDKISTCFSLGPAC